MYNAWNGKPLVGPCNELSLDTETAGEDPKRYIPTMVLATVYDGERCVVVHPDQMDDFVQMHFDRKLIGFNWAYDFWVVYGALKSENMRQVWKQMTDQNQLIDLMHLDMLIRLAVEDTTTGLYPRNLDAVSQDYTGVAVDKDSPYRTRFRELIGQDWNAVDQGFFDYATKDAIQTYNIYWPMLKRAVQAETFKVGAYPNASERYGFLTEAIQTKAAIALAQATRNGLAINMQRRGVVEATFRTELNKVVDRLTKETPGLFKTYKKGGGFKVSKTTGVPSMDQSVLLDKLQSLALDNKLYPPRTGRKGQLTLALDYWTAALPGEPYIAAWSKLNGLSKQLQFVAQLDTDRVHPGYRTLVRTGRTSATDPNIQQMPRENWCRSLFVADPGTKLVIVDYAAIELRTLATVLLLKFGKSKLADVIKGGVDPHEYTASMILGVTLDEFRAWKKDEQKKGDYKRFRQAAKAINFGVPGGLGPNRLREYATLNYGVSLSLAEATEFRTKLITEVYPEIGQYLDDDTVAVLAKNMGVSKVKAWMVLDWSGERPGWLPIVVQKIVQGNAYKKGGESYSTNLIDSVWQALDTLVDIGSVSDFVRNSVKSREPSYELYNILFKKNVTTLTGRVRCGVDYGESRNTPFQGLAADGAKMALWNLTKQGYVIKAFVHDEIVVQVPDYSAQSDAADVVRIMEDSMYEVMNKQVPVASEHAINSCWTK